MGDPAALRQLHQDVKAGKKPAPDSSPTNRDEIQEQIDKHGWWEPLARVSWLINPVAWFNAVFGFLDSCWQVVRSPCWETLSDEVLSEDDKKHDTRPKRMGPTTDDIQKYDCVGIQNFMGASCLAIGILPTGLAGYLYCSGQMQYNYCYTILMCTHLMVSAIIAFGGDYWYTEEKDFRKQLVMNNIDRMNVPLLSINCGLAGVALCFCAPYYNWIYPGLMVLFGSAVVVQQYASAQFRAFSDIVYRQDTTTNDQEGEAKTILRKGILGHSLWHIMAMVPPVWGVYAFMTHGCEGPAPKIATNEPDII